jgi:thiol-disulfide isomerase/thioredoxin
MLPLGTKLPSFVLPECTGGSVDTRALEGKPVLVAFICNHCPYVKHIKPELARLGRELAERGVAMLAINANDAVAYPADAPEKMAEDKRAFGYPFPYLFDEDQRVARAFDAACTPEFYLFDAQHALVYRGQFDDSRPGNNKPVTGKDVRDAVDALLEGRPISRDQVPSIGCNIKWKDAP